MENEQYHAVLTIIRKDYIMKYHDLTSKAPFEDLSTVNVNMFKALNNQLINDGCGLFRGRQILPFEHLSRFQNDLID